jgi:zinc protease
MSRRHLAVAISIGACLATVPVAAQQRSKPITVPYQMFTLPNGLTVILHEDHSVPLVSVNVWYHVGSANENPAARDSRISSSI